MLTLATPAILLPGLGALLAAVVGYGAWPEYRRQAEFLAVALTTGAVTLAALFAWVLFFTHAGTAQLTWLTWLSLPGLTATFGAQVDALSTTMLLVVGTVSACVHWYSIAYMAEEPSRTRFFIYLSIFTLAMNLLVAAPNLLQMFLGWEGVGVCSYLLIGYWNHKPSANAAAIKASIVNRTADAAMLLGLFLLFQTFGTLTYAEIFSQLASAISNTEHRIPNTDLIALLLFIGAMGKSAQLGFHTWLPDAMEGPTPVSALIHAATMVTAGVFLLCRLSPLYELTPGVLNIVAWVGAATAMFAATIGLTQPDIKRVIAYSTCSQLGYMFFAIGVSAYPAAMFHLTTHAFFKALLFLGAGGVITAAHHEQNLFHLGGYKKVLPVTYGLMWVGSLALAGIPPFAGFFSKDLILESAYMSPTPNGIALFTLGTLAALLTAMYSFRVLFLAFEGKLKHHEGPEPTPAQPRCLLIHPALLNLLPSTITRRIPARILRMATPQEHAPALLWLPLLPLALGAVLSGMVFHGMAHLEWWQGALTILPNHSGLEESHHTPFLIQLLPLVAALSGLAAAWYLFFKEKSLAKQLAKTLSWLHALSLNKWYVDELYHALFVLPTRWLAGVCAWNVDTQLIDGTVNGTARTVWDFGQSLRTTQTGYLVNYALAMLVVLVLAFAYLLWGGLLDAF